MSEQVEQQVTEQQPAPEIPAADTQAPASAGAESAPPAAPSYEPNWKYQFDGAEKELDAFWRPLVKDKDSNQKVLDAVQQLEAFPKWKQKATEYEDTVNTVKQLSEMFQKGEHERVLEALGYKDDVLFDLVRQKLERSKLPPEQKQAFEEKRRLQLENEKLLADNARYQTTAERELARVTDYQLDMELGKAEYKKLVDAYDGTYGSGAFKKRVAQTGEAMVTSLGRHVPPAELLQTVMRDYAPFLQQPSAPAVEQPKVIPQVSGGSGTPGKKAVTSVAELRKLRQQMVQED